MQHNSEAQRRTLFFTHEALERRTVRALFFAFGGSMPFEKFVETSRSYRPRVSIRGSGAIGFNAGCLARFSLSKEKCPFMTLFYDGESKTIGLKPCVAEDEPGAHKVNFGRAGAVINARRFFDFFSIILPTKKPMKRDVRWSNENGMILINLEE